MSKPVKITFEPTGDAQLDAILGGGIPDRSTTILAGEPGSGKTILTLQLLFHAARAGKRCLYVTTLSEPSIKVIRYLQQFSFFDAALVNANFAFFDLGAALHESADRALAQLAEQVESFAPDFVAIDSFRAITDTLRKAGTTRSFTYDLSVQMMGWGTTTLLAGEYTRDEMRTFAEFAVADGIIHLASHDVELTSVRQVQVLKMRGASYVTGHHFYEITEDGLRFYPRVSAPLLGPLTEEGRVSTGISGMDELLRGGLPHGSATVIQGGTGTGKTLMSLQFIMDGARKGEHGLYLTLEETPDQLRRHARNVGADLSEYEKAGLITFAYASPVELLTDRYLDGARNSVAATGARRVVFDSLTSMALGIPSDRRFKELAYALVKHVGRAGATLILTMESEQLLGAASMSGHGVSFIADNFIQLRYVEIDGRVERAVSVLKARGIAHENELRSMRISSTGIEVVRDRFKDMRGVLTGLPQRAGSAE